jgi:dinuclear metal center YbgI/SA1388 family protein
MIRLASIVESLQRLAPLEEAAKWDNVGLLLGDLNSPIERIMTCLSVAAESAAEACEHRVGLIVTHHPILFRPVSRLTNETAEGRMLLSLCRAGVAVYSPHTAFDNARDGINQGLCRRLGLVDVAPLRIRESSGQYKIVVFVPEQDLQRVADAMFAAGAGNIGDYSQCSFRVPGTGTFFGSEASNPAIGLKGRREQVAEWRFEAICPAERLKQVVAALRQAHSYEEPAYDIHPLHDLNPCGGEGRIGRLPQRETLQQLGLQVKAALHVDHLQLVGSLESPVERVAVACGAAGEFLKDAATSGAEAFLTGEMRFNDCLAARSLGIGLILPGHYATERCGVEELAQHLQERWPELEVWASKREGDPVHFL